MRNGRSRSLDSSNGKDNITTDLSELWGIKFPRDMDIDTKGLLLSAVFLFVSLKFVLANYLPVLFILELLYNFLF